MKLAKRGRTGLFRSQNPHLLVTLMIDRAREMPPKLRLTVKAR
jgi:hypothetical protein